VDLFVYRSAREDYSDEAIGFVQIKRQPEFNLCYVKAKITPEHRVNAKPYSVLCIINEKDSEIIKAVCEDCAACQGRFIQFSFSTLQL
jgi:hypothetical protein